MGNGMWYTLSDGRSQRMPTRSGGWLCVITITFLKGLISGLMECMLYYFVPLPNEICTKHVNVVFNSSNVGVEKVGYHSTLCGFSSRKWFICTRAHAMERGLISTTVVGDKTRNLSAGLMNSPVWPSFYMTCAPRPLRLAYAYLKPPLLLCRTR